MSSAAKILIDGIGNWVVCEELDPAKSIITIGRGADCDIVLKNLSVSSKHAELRLKGGKYHLNDLGSRNSTFVNNTKLEGAVELNDGDEIKIDPFTLTFQDEADDVAPTHTLAGASIEELLKKRREKNEKINAEKVSADDSFLNMQEQLEGLTGTRDAVGSPPATAQIDAGAYAQLQQSLHTARRTSQRLANQLKLARRALYSVRSSRCYRDMLKMACDLLNAEIAFFMLINPKTKKWEVVCNCGDTDDLNPHAEDESGQKQEGSPISLTLVGESIKRQEAITTEDLEEDVRESSKSIMLNAIQSGLAAPVMEEDKVVGCLYFDRRERMDQMFDEHDRADATAFAEVFTDAVQSFLLRRVAQQQGSATMG
jgi:hypothetical protein